MRNIDYFDYKRLINERFLTPKHFSSVCLYGNYRAVAKLKKSRFNFITEYLEHGAALARQPEDVKLLGYANRFLLKRIYTFGNIPKSVLDEFYKIHHLKRKVIAIGPYIKGADFFKTKEELNILKRQYGRILLVFPSHSIENFHTIYSESDLIREILRIKKDFDTVFICLYWKDILNEERHSIYQKYGNEGFKIVSAGYRSDPRFLSRLKDLIWLSDITMSNSIGTHLGYTVCMGKPHYLFRQKIDYDINNIKIENYITNNPYYNVETEFCKLFGHYSTEITQKQIELVEQYWGKWD
jgi:hypothetical protein